MNARLATLFRSLDATSKTDLSKEYAHSPAMLRLIRFLETIEGPKFSSRKAVEFIYGKNVEEKTAVLENRFYKLRKKLIDRLSGDKGFVQSDLSVEEVGLRTARSLQAKGEFQEAERILTELEESAWKNNLFEVLPEILDLLVQVRQNLNRIDQNRETHLKIPIALQLFHDLMLAKNFSRRIYEVNFVSGFPQTQPLYEQLSKFARKHSRYPRFKLIYNFVAAFYKVGSGTPAMFRQINITNRHIGLARKIMEQNPEMPVLNSGPDALISQKFRLKELQAMSYYVALHFQEAVAEILPLHQSVMQKDSPMARQRSEVFFSNVIHILCAAKRIEEAKEAAKDFLHFLTQNKRLENAPLVYAEMGYIHVSAFPEKSGYNFPDLQKKIDAQLTAYRKGTGNYFMRALLILKIKMLLIDQKFESAHQEVISPDFQKQLKIEPALKELEKLVQTLFSREKRERFVQIQKNAALLQDRAQTPSEFLNYGWVANYCHWLLNESGLF